MDKRISPWRDTLPSAASPVDQVDAIVEFLCDKYNEARENALVLLLRVLSDRTDPGDVCHRQLAALANELEQVFRMRHRLG